MTGIVGIEPSNYSNGLMNDGHYGVMLCSINCPLAGSLYRTIARTDPLIGLAILTINCCLPGLVLVRSHLMLPFPLTFFGLGFAD